jgi:hypothetical protein
VLIAPNGNVQVKKLKEKLHRTLLDVCKTKNMYVNGKGTSLCP